MCRSAELALQSINGKVLYNQVPPFPSSSHSTLPYLPHPSPPPMAASPHPTPPHPPFLRTLSEGHCFYAMLGNAKAQSSIGSPGVVVKLLVGREASQALVGNRVLGPTHTQAKGTSLMGTFTSNLSAVSIQLSAHEALLLNSKNGWRVLATIDTVESHVRNGRGPFYLKRYDGLCRLAASCAGGGLALHV